MRRFGITVATVLAVACGPHAVKPAEPPPDLSAGDALVLRGCYDCLLEARAIFRRGVASTVRVAALPKLFEVSVLITLREKELALDAAASLAEAEAVARELPPEIDAAHYLAIVAGIPGDDVGVPRSTVRAFRQAQADAGFDRRVGSELAWLDAGALSKPFRDYLALALDGAYRESRSSTPPLAVATVTPETPLLVRYRAALYRRISQRELEGIRAEEPRFVETAIPLARIGIALAEELGPGAASARLAEAREPFSESTAVSYLSGSFSQAIGDCDGALRYYDQTLSKQPLHEDALLGRTVCLTFLLRRADAIASATRMIELNLDNAGHAYYWRAWNKHADHDLPGSRADVDRARISGPAASVRTLAGIIEFEQGDLDLADRDERSARAMFQDDSNCTAIWYLGLVGMKREKWAEAGGFFTDAMKCNEVAAASETFKASSLERREDLDEAFRLKRIALLRDSAKEHTTQRFAAAMNAANTYAAGGNVAEAKRLVEIAAQDPALAEPVKKLKDWLKDKWPAAAYENRVSETSSLRTPAPGWRH